MAVERQPPDVLAMVLADTVLFDIPTSKLYIQGTYSAIFAAEFPAVYPAIVVYVAITNGHGMTELEMRLVDVDEVHPPIFASKTDVDFPDPLQVVERVFTGGPVAFPKEGEYRIQLFGAGHLLRERRLQVIPRPGASSQR
jgi:hypothetical protein